MNEEILQNMSRALTHLVFRNGIVEKLHSEGRCLDNETMKILNKDINNRMYTYLSACFAGDEIELEKLDKYVTISCIVCKNLDKKIYILSKKLP